MVSCAVWLQWQLAPSPGKARWLSTREREWLQQRQDAAAAAAAVASGTKPVDHGSASELPSKWAGAKRDLMAVRGACRGAMQSHAAAWMLPCASSFVPHATILTDLSVIASASKHGALISTCSEYHVLMQGCMSIAPAKTCPMCAAVMRLWRVWYLGLIWMLAETSVYGVVRLA